MIRGAVRFDRTSLRWLLASVVVFGLGITAGAYVAARAMTHSLEPPTRPAIYVVESGSLGRTLTVAAAARWNIAGYVVAPAGGVVTELNPNAGAIAAGEVVIRINERPVVAVPGPVPAFRELTEGVSGRDVSALNAYVASLGYDVDSTSRLYDERTAAAVGAWQEELGLPATGRVELGDVIFLPPEFIDGPPFRVERELFLGATISSGAVLLERLELTPAAVMEFGGSAPDQLAPGLRGIARFPTAEIVDISLGESSSAEGRTLVPILGPHGGSICIPAECVTLVPPATDTSLEVELTLVPDTSGPVVPSAAIFSDATGTPFVVLSDGTRRDVDVLVSDGGLAIVSGVEPGDELRLP